MHIITGHIRQQVSSPHCLENELLVVYWMYLLYFLGNELFWIEFELNWIDGCDYCWDFMAVLFILSHT